MTPLATVQKKLLPYPLWVFILWDIQSLLKLFRKIIEDSLRLLFAGQCFLILWVWTLFALILFSMFWGISTSLLIVNKSYFFWELFPSQLLAPQLLVPIMYCVSSVSHRYVNERRQACFQKSCFSSLNLTIYSLIYQSSCWKVWHAQAIVSVRFSWYTKFY